MNEIGLIISWVLQLSGLLIVLGSNLWLFYKARTGKFHSLKKQFVDQTAIQIGMDEEKLLKADADEAVKKFRIAYLLYTNYRDSFIGVMFTLAGVILGAITFFT